MSPYQTRFDGRMNSGMSVSQQATQAFSQSVHTVQPFVPRGKLKESSQMMDQSQNRYGYQNQMLYSPVAQTPHSDTRPKQGQMSITINPMEKPFPLILPKNFQSIEQTHSPTSGST
ncbi:hypothetical protein BLNAU_21439 [Blattamonas nauphoetae]|uniref:Uncharacterized protein n=1 Tax=Blattamonas nauphoetae TaxID=2049346 RepID=A0ABQ9WVY1_9EUKA|nr:hypothetical protein BLNAU_21439 [Blattamonas nauphoetae]